MKYFLFALIFVQVNYAQAVPQYDQKLAFPFHFETNQYTGNKVTVTSQAELLSALSYLDNTDIIELADGNYGRLNIANINPTSELIIKSEHNRGAVFSNIEFLNSSNVTLEGVRVDMDLEEFYGVEVRDSSGIKIKHSYIYAPDFNSGKNLFVGIMVYAGDVIISIFPMKKSFFIRSSRLRGLSRE